MTTDNNVCHTDAILIVDGRKECLLAERLVKSAEFHCAIVKNTSDQFPTLPPCIRDIAIYPRLALRAGSAPWIFDVHLGLMSIESVVNHWLRFRRHIKRSREQQTATAFMY